MCLSPSSIWRCLCSTSFRAAACCLFQRLPEAPKEATVDQHQQAVALPLSPTHDEGVKRRAIEAAPHWTNFSLFSYCPFSFFLLSYLEKIGWKNNWLKTKPREAESNLFLNIHDWKYSYYGGACSKSHTYPNSLSTPINLICYLSYHTAL